MLCVSLASGETSIMTTPQDVLIKGERHLIIHGQFGNLQTKINQLEQALKDQGGEAFLPPLFELERELEFLKDVYPALDGAVKYPNVVAGRSREGGRPPGKYSELSLAAIRICLRDMRVLADAAYTSCAHDGAIACHLRVMFDRAWDLAAKEAGIDIVDDPPF